MYVVLKTKQGKRGCPLYIIRYNIQSHLKQPKQPKSLEYTGVKGRLPPYSPFAYPYRGSEASTTRGCRASFRKFSGIQNAFSFKSSDFLIFNFAIVVSQVVCLQHENI